MQGEAENFIDTVDNLFVHFPKLIEDEEFQRRTKAILKQVKDYIKGTDLCQDPLQRLQICKRMQVSVVCQYGKGSRGH